MQNKYTLLCIWKGEIMSKVAYVRVFLALIKMRNDKLRFLKPMELRNGFQKKCQERR